MTYIWGHNLAFEVKPIPKGLYGGSVICFGCEKEKSTHQMMTEPYNDKWHKEAISWIPLCDKCLKTLQEGEQIRKHIFEILLSV